MSSRDRTPKRALIVGFSVEGMALAMFLKRVGFEPSIYARDSRSASRERPESFVEISSIGIDVLRTLGVLPEALRAGWLTTDRVFQNHRGRMLGRVEDAKVVIRHDALWNALSAAALTRNVRMDFDKGIEGVDTTARSVAIARFSDGSEERCDVLVGADGPGSRTRALAFPWVPAPRFTGIVHSAGVTRAESGNSPSSGVRLTFGREGFFGYQAMPSGETRWFENFFQPGDIGEGNLRALADQEWQTRLLAIHRLDPAPIPQIIMASRGPISRRAIYASDPMDTWHSGPVGLIGEAAHPMPPEWSDLSLGLEDAAVLARCLRDLPDAQRALAAYEAVRKGSVETQAREAWRRTQYETARGPFGRRVRDLLLPMYLRRVGADSVLAGHPHLDFAARAA